MSNNYRSRNRIPFNFIDGLAIKGVDITHLMDIGTPIGSTMVGHNEGTVSDAFDDVAQSIQDLAAVKADKENPQFTGQQVTIPEGTRLAPGLTFANDGTPDTGLYHINDGSFGATCNTELVAEFTPNGVNLSKEPTAPTPDTGDNTGRLATTQFVRTAISEAVSQTKEAMFPIGSTYTNATVGENPSVLLGFGTWAPYGIGRVLVGINAEDPTFQTAGLYGGVKNAVVVSHTHGASTGFQSSNHTHSGTTQSAGAHNHEYYISPTAANSGGQQYTPRQTGSVILNTNNAGNHQHSFTTLGVDQDHTHPVYLSSTGVSGTNANLQPYVTVYMWVRTA